MRSPRFFPGADRPTEVVRKCTEHRFLMKPDSYLRDRMVGVYARAQEVTGMTIFAAVALSNHTHELIAPTSAAQRTDWLRHTGTNLSKLIKRHRAWEAPVFTRRPAVIPCTDERASWVERLKYILAHGTKESLVPHPGLWLGMQCVEALCAGRMELEGIWCNRSAHRRALAAWNRERARLQLTGRQMTQARPRAEDFEQRVSLRLSKLPGMEHLSDTEYGAWIRSLVKEVLETYSGERHRIPERWRELLQRTRFEQRPQSSPKRVVPRCHATSKTKREAFARSWRHWMARYREASAKLRDGVLSAVELFPEGAILPPFGSHFDAPDALATL